jgi:hypothetical protein
VCVLPFSNNTSWRFIPADYEFPNEANPWQEPFPELLSFNNLQGAQLDANFIGVKVGDVTLDAITLDSDIVETHTVEDRSLSIPDTLLLPGKVHTLPISIANPSAVAGLQLALRTTASVAAFDLQPNISIAGRGQTYRPNSETIHMSWVIEEGNDVSAGEPLFWLKIQPLVPVRSSTLLVLAEEAMSSEMIRSEEQLAPLMLHFERGAVAQPFAFFSPNVIREAGFLQVNAQRSGPGQLRFFDSMGRQIFSQTFHLVAGEQQLMIPRPSKWANGILFYSFIAEELVASGKVVIQ